MALRVADLGVGGAGAGAWRGVGADRHLVAGMKKLYTTPPYRKDANHDELCNYARELGVQVLDCPWAGRYDPGWPDALFVVAGVIVMVEIKTLTGEMLDSEIEWHSRFTGPIEIVRTEKDVRRVIEKYGDLRIDMQGQE